MQPAAKHVTQAIKASGYAAEPQVSVGKVLTHPTPAHPENGVRAAAAPQCGPDRPAVAAVPIPVGEQQRLRPHQRTERAGARQPRWRSDRNTLPTASGHDTSTLSGLSATTPLSSSSSESRKDSVRKANRYFAPLPLISRVPRPTTPATSPGRRPRAGRRTGPAVAPSRRTARSWPCPDGQCPRPVAAQGLQRRSYPGWCTHARSRASRTARQDPASPPTQLVARGCLRHRGLPQRVQQRLGGAQRRHHAVSVWAGETCPDRERLSTGAVSGLCPRRSLTELVVLC
jgi:hypothetical protein